MALRRNRKAVLGLAYAKIFFQVQPLLPEMKILKI